MCWLSILLIVCFNSVLTDTNRSLYSCFRYVVSVHLCLLLLSSNSLLYLYLLWRSGVFCCIFRQHVASPLHNHKNSSRTQAFTCSLNIFSSFREGYRVVVWSTIDCWCCAWFRYWCFVLYDRWCKNDDTTEERMYVNYLLRCIDCSDVVGSVEFIFIGRDGLIDDWLIFCDTSFKLLRWRSLHERVDNNTRPTNG